MEFRRLGKSELNISPIVFGAWAIGGWMWGGSDEKAAVEAIHASIDAGVNLIDTAAVYGMGASEEIVGKAIKGKRDKVLIATKGGRNWNTDTGSMIFETEDTSGNKVTVRSNSRPDLLKKECEDSLRRLGVDVIDLYQIHWPDLTFPIDEAVAGLEQLKKEGKVRAVGVSNYNIDQLKTAAAAAQLDSLQPSYSLIQRDIEKEIVAFCLEENIGIICYSPMERGLLTGAVSASRVFPPSDHRSTHRFFTPENRQNILSALEEIKPIADKHKASFAQVVLRWTIDQPGITAAIVGARDAKQASHNIGALNVRLSEEEKSEMSRVFERCAEKMTAKA